MILNIYSIYDEKATVYQNLITFNTNGQALRVLADIVQDPKTTINKHPSDYKLYRLGSVDDNSGVITPLPVPELIGNAIDYVVEQK